MPMIARRGRFQLYTTVKDNFNQLNDFEYVCFVYNMENTTTAFYICKLDIYTYMLYCPISGSNLEER